MNAEGILGEIVVKLELWLRHECISEWDKMVYWRKGKGKFLKGSLINQHCYLYASVLLGTFYEKENPPYMLNVSEDMGHISAVTFQFQQ